MKHPAQTSSLLRGVTMSEISNPYRVPVAAFESTLFAQAQPWAKDLAALAPDVDRSGVAGDSQAEIAALVRQINTDDDKSTVTSHEISAYLIALYDIGREKSGAELSFEQWQTDTDNTLKAMGLTVAVEQWMARYNGAGQPPRP